MAWVSAFGIMIAKVFGIRLSAGIRHGALDAATHEPIEANAALAHALIPLLDVRLELYRAFLELDRRVKALAHNDEVCLLLMTTPENTELDNNARLEKRTSLCSPKILSYCGSCLGGQPPGNTPNPYNNVNILP